MSRFGRTTAARERANGMNFMMPRQVIRTICITLLALAAGAGCAVRPASGDSKIFAKPPVAQTQANVMVELPFTASRNYADPFADVTLDVTFIDPTGHEMRVPAFWAGKNVWKVRYASPVVGMHL